MKRMLVFVTVLPLLFACQHHSENKAGAFADGVPAETEHATLDASPSSVDLYSRQDGKIIKNLNYKFEVKDLKATTAAIEGFIGRYPAYISSSSTSMEGRMLESKMTIRVASEFFNPLVKEIDGQAVAVHYRDLTTEDVSKTFVDLESRLKTKREVEARYISILRSKAGTIEELLNAEKQIGELQEEIEATISTMNHLKDQVRYSTITLSFFQMIEQPIASDFSTTKRFQEALNSGLTGVINVLVGLTYLWPLLALSLVAFAAYRIAVNRQAQ